MADGEAGVNGPTIDNRALLAELLTAGRVSVDAAPCLHEAPAPLPRGFDFDRVEGMLLGLAIGDALGNTSEGGNPAGRLARHGEIRDYLPNWRAGDRRVGLPSDDTQLAFWTLEQLVEDGGLVPEHLGERFCRQRIFGEPVAPWTWPGWRIAEHCGVRRTAIGDRPDRWSPPQVRLLCDSRPHDNRPSTSSPFRVQLIPK